MLAFIGVMIGFWVAVGLAVLAVHIGALALIWAPAQLVKWLKKW